MNKNGFTLTEMSIVLIVIAGIMGAISTAEGVRTQYKIRSIINDFNYYSGAIRTFQAIYGYLPGDFKKAGLLWSLPATNNCPNSAQPAGCNGFGNRTISQMFGAGAIRCWQHLALAGLIAGNYNCNGSACAAAPNGVPNTIPALKIPDVSMEFRNYQSLNSTVISIVIGGTNTNATNYGLPTQTGGTYVTADGITPEFHLLIVKGIDSKIDDGIANTGNILGVGTCSYLYSSLAGNDYILSNPYADCYLVSKWLES